MWPATRRLGVVVAAVLLLLSPRPRAAAVAEGAFQRYARGDFAVIESLTADELEAIRREVKGSALAPQMKAAFLLEAFETLQRRMQLNFGDRSFIGRGNTFDALLQSPLGHVFQDAYEVLAAVPAADKFVEQWSRAAAAALAHGAHGESQAEWNFVGFFRAATESIGNRFRFDAHLDPGELTLTRALPIERFAWRSVNQAPENRRTYVTAEQEAFGKVAEREIFPSWLGREKDAIRDALVELKKADAFESARPEALMRQGALVAASGHQEQALPLFEESERLTHDEWVAYLDHIFEGRALETLDRVAAAEASYRAALALRPKARSANLALSALLFAHGARADTNLLAVFDPASDRLDPWAQFTSGAYRFWPDRRDAMRRLLR